MPYDGAVLSRSRHQLMYFFLFLVILIVAAYYMPLQYVLGFMFLSIATVAYRAFLYDEGQALLFFVVLAANVALFIRGMVVGLKARQARQAR